MILGKRRSVAPVIATLLMVAIAVVGGMLVFVFAQDFFTSTDTMTGPTIEILQIFGYDARDRVSASPIENHAGDECTVLGVAGGTLQDDDVFALYVRNLGSNDVIIGDVSVFNTKGKSTTRAVTSVTHPDKGEWAVVEQIANDVCGATNSGSGTVIGAGRDATILIAFATGTGQNQFGEPVKLGRPIFVKVETSSGNIFTKQIVNGRQVG